MWTLAYGGRAVQLRDTKGLRDLAALIARPGRELAVHELIGAPAGRRPFELADRTAIDAYRRRLADLEEERADASALHDPVRRSGRRPSAMHCSISWPPSRGWAGIVASAGSDIERMRKAVGNRIQSGAGPHRGCPPGVGPASAGVRADRDLLSLSARPGGPLAL